MPSTTTDTTDSLRFQIDREMQISAPASAVWQAILDEVTEIHSETGDSLKLKLETFPGGRWYRDLGNDAGHLWGHVQVIKPPTLLEIYGPLMMSMAVTNHVSYRVLPDGEACRLLLKHRAFGDIDPRMRDGMPEEWEITLSAIKKKAESSKGK